MRTWLKALFSETLFSVWWLLSALSTLATFFFHSLAGVPRIVLLLSTLIGFAWANFRVFQKQERRIAAAEIALAAQNARFAELRITPDHAASRFILFPVQGVQHADFNGGYFEFRLMIENVGRRNSIVNNYVVEIVELNREYPNLRPQEGQNGAQGRHGHYGLNPSLVLSRTGIVRIDAETATDRGTLLFLLPDLTLDQFVNAGLRMEGEDHRFGVLHCRLTLADTAQSSVTQEFQLHEA